MSAPNIPQDGRVLVLGAGGGLELKVFAEAHPDWRFDGVDPSDEMLKLADATLGSLASRVAGKPQLYVAKVSFTLGPSPGEGFIEHLDESVPIIRVGLPIVELHELFDLRTYREPCLLFFRDYHVAALRVWFEQRPFDCGGYFVGVLCVRGIIKNLLTRSGALHFVLEYIGLVRPWLDHAYLHA